MSNLGDGHQSLHPWVASAMSDAQLVMESWHDQKTTAGSGVACKAG